MNFKEHIRVVEDFPKPGIRFKDITTLLKNGGAFKEVVNQMAELFKDRKIDKIAGPEARGFVIGAPLAYALGVGFVPIRKSGKLPAEYVEQGYELEYGQDKLAMHKDAIQPGEKILIADDLLATGGTISTCVNLINQLQGEIVGAAFLIELLELNGREKLGNTEVFSLVQY
ncbi:adenine phosphoribosyltransferase [Ferviditalea candida]|uniref:Adenine phosphoribosyltransferase n=1 Tax=Ferviditalea candida TaxID=3108399 RepID=A0ABU5ZLN8_9BACL|nr:adenine phosphoribosyltransferase [Paenibacillaceae bacterium T2]